MNSREGNFKVKICHYCGKQFLHHKRRNKRPLHTFELGICDVCGEERGVTSIFNYKTNNYGNF
jgi:rRNA maturation endonuclease Nob1